MCIVLSQFGELCYSSNRNLIGTLNFNTILCPHLLVPARTPCLGYTAFHLQGRKRGANSKNCIMAHLKFDWGD
jgi:hypothetical protein